MSKSTPLPPPARAFHESGLIDQTKKVESGTTEGLTIKSVPEENRGKPDLPPTPPLHPTPRAGNSLWETLVNFNFNF